MMYTKLLFYNWLSLRIILIQPTHFLKFLGKSQPQRSDKEGSSVIKQTESPLKPISAAPKHWNDLPAALRMDDSLTTLKTAINTCLFELES